MKNAQEVIYSLNVEDIQSVALQEIDRDLTSEEIENLKDSIADNINWYDAIAFAISQTVDSNTLS